MKVDINMHIFDNTNRFRSSTVACIIPYFNGSDVVERAIKSILWQTVQPDEIIIVDDGSMAEESLALKQLQKKYKFRLIKQENGGQGSARNAGVEGCRSDLICFLDQDDFFLPNHIEVLKKAVPIDDPLFGYVYSDLYEADFDGRILSHSLLRRTKTENPKGHLSNMLRYDLYILPSATIISKHAFQFLGGFDAQFTGYEDDDLFLRFFLAGFSNVFLPIPTSVWCEHENSTSHSIKMQRSRIRYIKKLYAMFPTSAFHGSYLKKYIEPRFHYGLFLDCIKAKIAKSPDACEVELIYREFCSMLQKDSSYSKLYLFKLKLKQLLISNTCVYIYSLLGNGRLVLIIKRMVKK